MNKYHIRKFIGLSILYSSIILGIFALQFRNESSITQTFGNLKLRLSQVSTKGEMQLKNSLKLSTSGITLYCSDSNPIILTLADGSIKPLSIVAWKTLSEKSCKIDFTSNTSIIFTSTPSKSTIFSVEALIPKNARRLTIPYKSGGAYTVTDYKTTKALFNSQTESYVLNAQNIAAKTFSITADSNIARYENYLESKEFSFDSVMDYELAKTSILYETTSFIKNKLITSYSQVKNTNVPEKAIASWIAEKALRADYKNAIKEVPENYKNGTNRTYLTTPYFNSLKKMNKTLVMQMENISFSMMTSITKKDLSVFELDDFSQFLLTKSDAICKSILSVPSAMTNFDPSISQAAGILHVYNALHEAKPSSAVLLEDVLQTCVDKIEKSCTATESVISILENESPINILTAVKAGVALIEFGKITHQQRLIAGGNIIINSALNKNEKYDMHILGQLYALLCSKDNTWYPHIEILDKNTENPIWAWTIAKKLSIEDDKENTTIIKCTFTQGDTHYMIIKGIKPFESIEIYGKKFRTDPRFESYNSSGYVYLKESETLLLKYRQKSITETVKLFR